MWTSDGTGVAKGTAMLDSGYLTADNVGHTVVVHSANGTKIACGVLAAARRERRESHTNATANTTNTSNTSTAPASMGGVTTPSANTNANATTAPNTSTAPASMYVREDVAELEGGGHLLVDNMEYDLKSNSLYLTAVDPGALYRINATASAERAVVKEPVDLCVANSMTAIGTDLYTGGFNLCRYDTTKAMEREVVFNAGADEYDQYQGGLVTDDKYLYAVGMPDAAVLRVKTLAKPHTLVKVVKLDLRTDTGFVSLTHSDSNGIITGFAKVAKGGFVFSQADTGKVVHVADPVNGDGKATVIASGFGRPGAIVANAAGTIIYVADTELHRIVAINLFAKTSAGAGVVSVDGVTAVVQRTVQSNLLEPAGMCMIGSDLVVLEQGRKRLLYMNDKGNFQVIESGLPVASVISRSWQPSHLATLPIPIACIGEDVYVYGNLEHKLIKLTTSGKPQIQCVADEASCNTEWAKTAGNVWDAPTFDTTTTTPTTTTPVNATEAPAAGSSDDDDAGMIAGIVIAILVACCCCAGIAYYLTTKGGSTASRYESGGAHKAEEFVNPLADPKATASHDGAYAGEGDGDDMEMKSVNPDDNTWVAQVDPATGETYYINKGTKQQSWAYPSDPNAVIVNDSEA